MPNDSRPLTSQVPYLLRALHEWMLDNSLTPHILVDTSIAGVDVPISAIKDGKVVLNIQPGATANLYFGKDIITFAARFNQVSQNITVPYRALIAIYARENGRGMSFVEQHPGDDSDTPPPSAPEPTPPTPPKRGSHLSVVK